MDPREDGHGGVTMASCAARTTMKPGCRSLGCGCCARTARSALSIVALIAALGPGCMQPDPALDAFGTQGQSSVTGDDAGPALARDPSGNDSDPPGSDDDVESTDDSVDSASAVDGSKRPDAGAKVVDSGKPRTADAATTPPTDGGTIAAQGDGGTTAPGASTLTKLSFSVTTTTLRGRYSPRNIYAIWVTDAQGKFIKTLAKFAFIRARYLSGWNAASGGNVVDAVTGATMSNHGTRLATWNFTDVAKKPVPDGDYKVVVEMTDADKTGASASIPFTKGAEPVKLMPADQGSFLEMSLVLE
jgi:hypothetical protein